MPLRLPHLRQLFVRALLGMAALICAPYAAALDVNASFTIAQQPAVVDLNGALVAGADYAATFTEAGGAVAIADPAAATLTDLIQDTVVGARVRITNQLDGGAELLDAVITGTAIAKSYDASTGLLTLSGVDTVAHYQAVLRSLVYDNSSLNPSATARVISVIVNDGFVDSLAANCVLTMIPVNNAPALDLNGPLVAGGNFAALFIEGQGAVVVVDATALTVADPDNATLVSATATITARQDGAAERLDATVQGGISKSFDAATGVLTLTGSASLAAYQAVLRTLTYDNVGSPPIGGNRQVTVVVNDGALDSPTVFCVLGVQARNHTPTLDVLADRSVLENSGLLSIPLTGIGDGGDLVAQNLTVTATSSNPAILLNPTVVYTSAQATGTLMLAPVAFEFGTATVTVTVHDDGGTAFGSLDTFSRTFQLTIVPVNQRPTLAALADLVINEDDPAQTVQIAGISAGPANEAAQVLTVTAISSRPDIIPNPTVFYASPQAAGALQFTPLAHQSGVVTIFVQVADNGGTANGGRDRVARSFTVTVTPKSHVPVLVTDAGLTVAVHGSGVISYLALETQDFGPASSLVYHLSALPTDGLLELGGTALTLSDTFTQAEINSGLLSYVNTGFVAGSDGFQFTVVNAQGNSLPVTAFPITISGAAVGTTPAVTLPGPAVTWVQGGGPVVLDGGATVVDASGTLAGGNLQISLIANGSAGDLLAVRSVGNGLGQIAVAGSTVNYEGTPIGTLSGGSGAALVVTLAAAADPTAVQALLRSITFDNADAAPSAATRRAQVVLDNGAGGISAPAGKDIIVQPVDQAPVVTLPSRAITYVEGSGARVLDPTATFSDADSPQLTGGTLVATWTAGAGVDDQLTVRNQGAGANQVSVVGNAISFNGAVVGFSSGGVDGGPLTIVFTSQATPAIAQALLRNLSFTNVSSNPSIANRVLSVVANDGVGGVSVPAVLTVIFSAVNNAPVVTLPSPAATYQQGQGVLPVDALATISDPDTAAYPTGFLVVEFTSGATVDDQLLFTSTGSGPGQIAVNGGVVSYEGTAFGVVSGTGTATNPLLVRFDANATVAATQALLRQAAFLDAALPPVGGVRTVQVTLNDGAGTSSVPVTKTIAVQIVDVPPVVTLPSAPGTWTEGDAPLAIDAAATLTDADSAAFPGGSLTISLANGVAGDVLDLRDDGTGAGQIGVAGGTVTFAGTAIGTFTGGSGGAPLVLALNAQATPAATQAALRNVRFTHNGVFTVGSVRTVQVVANDGQAASVVATTTITLVPVPTALDVTLYAVSDLPTSGLLPASGPLGHVLTWQLVSAPTHGTATLLDAATGLVGYAPVAGYTGNDAFTFAVSDGINTSTPATATVVVSSRLAAARPQVVTSPPREGFLGTPLVYALVADATLLPAGADLQFQIVGAPSGVTVTKTGAATATVSWTAGGAPEVHQEIGILIVDPVSGSATFQAIQVLFHAGVGSNG